MSTSPVSKNSGIYLTEPNNIFELQNEVTNKLNEFEKSRIHYIKCNDDSMPLSNVFPPVCPTALVTSTGQKITLKIDGFSKPYGRTLAQMADDTASNERFDTVIQTFPKELGRSPNRRNNFNKR